MKVRSPAEWLFDALTGLAPKSKAWRGVFFVTTLVCSAALFYSDFTHKNNTRQRVNEAILDQHISDGRAQADFMQRIEK